MNKGMKIFIIILVVFVLLAGVASFSGFNESTELDFSFSPNIAIIYVDGVIEDGTSGLYETYSYNHSWTLNKINDITNDNKNKALIVFINSPGGGIYETDELYIKIKEYQELTERPVYAVMGSLAASGGYYLASAADKIFINRNTLTGSIGVTMGTYYDISGFLERYGIKTNTITAGNNKAMGDMTQPMTQEQKDILLSIVDDAYEQFVGIVAEERNIEIDEMRKIADGRLYTAKQALELGLVDEAGNLEMALADLIKRFDLLDCTLKNYIFEDDSILSKIARLQGNISVPSELSSIINLTGMSKDRSFNMPVTYLVKW